MTATANDTTADDTTTSAHTGGRRLHRSVLDLSMVPDGSSSGDALRETTELARRAEELGYERFWVAEHHNMPTIASTSPPVLMAHLAASTSRIRIGSGGVMLPNHPSLVVAEQFAMLEALHPGRIDLGIGRAPGTDGATAAALRRDPSGLGAEDFPGELLDLMGMLGDRRRDRGAWDRFRATPVLGSTPEVVLLGSSGYSGQLAGLLGLRYAFAHHFDVGTAISTLDAVALYRESFRPSAVLDEPYTIVTAGVLAAESDERARYLAAPAQLAILALRTGRRMGLLSPEDAAAHPDVETARSMPSNRVVGGPDTVAQQLMELAARTEADELMVSTMAYGLDQRIDTLRIVSEVLPERVA
ncbi:LLM class flavin-dependent oxidoreductase [Desertimonas flava]|uniref:LLM class flavin-dependent oxidoreductase n=1 Tax=Desertimonas flava TaxID=2064846 RepID=UPI000E35793B|nr:LLM class flavin-dependent oxidoreductase [Desertimonas flava]